MSPASNAEAGPSNPVVIEIDEDEHMDEQTKAAMENERINEVCPALWYRSVVTHIFDHRNTKYGRRTRRSCTISSSRMP